MWRRRWLRLSLLLLILAGGGGGYRITHRDGPSLVLRTTTTGSASGGGGAFLAALNPWSARFYIHTFGDNVLHVVDTRTGDIVYPNDIVAQLPGPLVNYRVPHLYMDDTPDQGLVQLDARTLAPQHRTTVGEATSFWFLDEPSDRFYLGSQANAINIFDGPTGRWMRVANACSPGSANLVESHPDGHLFLPCADGTTAMYNARTGRLLRSINTARLGDCTCRRIADDLTGRIFAPGSTALGVLDARTGALLSTLPIRTWAGAAFELDGHAGGVIEMDAGTGNMVVAPYVPSGKGPPAAAVLVLDGHSGAILHRWAVPANPTAILVNPLTLHLLVASAGPVDSLGNPLGNGFMSVLDLASGVTLQRIEVGILPGTIFADQRTGHLLVVNYTTDLADNLLSRSYPDGWWPRMQRWLKHTLGWLPFAAPAQPSAPDGVTLTMLDLTKL